jgi:hypothetical protein
MLDKKIKKLISEREKDLNCRKKKNSDIARIFSFRDILECLNRAHFKNRSRIWSPKNQIFLFDEDNFVFLPISLLAKGKYFILTAVNGEGIHIAMGYKWSIFSDYNPLPGGYSPEDILKECIFCNNNKPKKLCFGLKKSGYLPIENLENESEAKRKYQDKLEGIIAPKFFEFFFK